MSEWDSLPDGYIELAIAVVQQAVEDYRSSFRYYLRSGRKSKRFYELEDWFTNGDGRFWSFGLGQKIVDKVRHQEYWKYKRRNEKLGYQRPIEYKGKTQAISDWAKELGIPPNALYLRLYRGWTVEQALSIPYGGRHDGQQQKQEI